MGGRVGEWAGSVYLENALAFGTRVLGRLRARQELEQRTAAPSCKEGFTMHVETILATKGSDVVTARPDDVISQAATRLEGHGIGALVVVDSAGAPIGILSERDIARGLTAFGARLPDIPVRELMSRKVVTCGPGDSVAELMTVMTEKRIRHLPVVSGGKLAGIVSIGDAVKVRLGEIESEANAMRAYIAGA